VDARGRRSDEHGYVWRASNVNRFERDIAGRPRSVTIMGGDNVIINELMER
jgi:hypothetical protein